MVLPGSQEKVFQPPKDLQKDAHIPDFKSYLRLYKKSTEEPETFWKEVAEDFYWKTPPTGQILQYNFDITKGSIYVKFMEGAKTNVCYNVLDRNILEKNLGEKVAFYWEGNSPDHQLSITYNSLLAQVCKCANVLRHMGIKKGDRVAIYLPMIPELVYTMLACARIGAVHSIVNGFGSETYKHNEDFKNIFLNIIRLPLCRPGYCLHRFSSESLCERILDAQISFLVTADGVYRGEKLINLKQIADEALGRCRLKDMLTVKKCMVVRRQGVCTVNGSPSDGVQSLWDVEFDVWWDEVMETASETCEPEWMDAEDPLFILYTSGSTGKPKGVVHTTAGYLLYTALTFKYVFDHRPDDVYWCTADIGWITGHSYITYGPLANGATSVLFEGVPVYPHVGRYWEIIEKYSVNTFYTAPTAIRLLMKFGKEPLQRYNLGCLRILGTVGEPINPEAWLWYHQSVGRGRCPVMDTFWQTETGGHVLTPLPAAMSLKPGSATLPFFGVQPAILNERGEELEGEAEGHLVFRKPWPGIMRTIHGNPERFENTYFKEFPGFYVTGDGCRRDKDGYYWITGRIDDMLNVSGHLLSTAEVEAALAEHQSVAEAAVVSRPHAVKGECLYCFITLKDGMAFSRTLTEELKRQGKIMRRILRKIARNEKDLGDLSTMADPKVVEVLFSQRCETAS